MTSLAVCVQNAYKSYGSSSSKCQVLKNMCMKVQSGQIYALVGASGCGKSTLLKCMLNRCALDSGRILIFGLPTGSPDCGIPGNRVGYMPQDICLHLEFTADEMLTYFGRVHGMTREEIRDKVYFLRNLMKLPSADRVLGSLSGGQQRRVSFAVAIIHDPEILVLDEPTVGLDPVLRQQIWEHLVTLATNSKRTIIITTHYVEETTQANTVGIMRNGRLLDEDAPRNILYKCDTQSMEDAVLKLCLQNETIQGEVSEQRRDNRRSSTDDHLVRKDSSGMSECGELRPVKWKDKRMGKRQLALFHYWALSQRMWLGVIHNVGVIVLILLVPIVIVGLFALCVGGRLNNINIALVNEEFPEEPVCQPYADGCIFVNMSCSYMHSMDSGMIRLVPYPSIEEAEAAVMRGDAWGSLTFGANFSENFQRTLITLLDASDDIVDSGTIKIRLDMSNQQIGLLAQREFLLTYQNLLKKYMDMCDISTEVGNFPVKIDEPYYGSATPTFLDYTAPGIIINVVFILSAVISAAGFIRDKKEKMIERSWIAGITSLQQTCAFFTFFFCVMIVQTTEVIIVVLLIFQVPIRGSLFLLILLTLLDGCCGVASGCFISVIAGSEEAMVLLLVLLIFPPFIASGSIWPLETMPWVVRQISSMFAFTHSSESLRCIMGRGWGFTHPLVWPGFVATIAWTLGIGILVWLLLWRRKSTLA